MISTSDHSERVRQAVESKEASSVVASSWRRSLFLHNLDPDEDRPPRRRSDEEVAEAKTRAALLIECAARPLDDLFALLEQDDFCVILTDASGCVLSVRTRTSHDFWDRTADKWTGTDFGEGSEGTNGIGTTLREQRPITISDGDHFYARNCHILCSGAPVFGPEGAVAGTVDVARLAGTESKVLSALIMSCVIETARHIELAFFRRTFEPARIMHLPSTGYKAVGAVAIGEDDIVIGATYAARQALGLDRHSRPLRFSASEMWPAPGATEADGSLAQMERRAIVQALARHRDNTTVAAKALGISRGTLHRKRAYWRI